MVHSKDTEKMVYRWCTREARGTPSAKALAAIYASTYMEDARLLRFTDLRALDDTRLEWAIDLITGYVEGQIEVPWPRAVTLVALYELLPLDADV